MINLSKVKYYLYFYRYNILVPSIVGGIILADIYNNRRKRELALAEARRKEAKKAATRNSSFGDT